MEVTFEDADALDVQTREYLEEALVLSNVRFTALKQIDEYDADGGCKKAYQKSAKRVLRMSNEDFDKALTDILLKVK